MQSKCLCMHALNGYETYAIDDHTIGVRPIWNVFNDDDKRLENHKSYYITDGKNCDLAYWDMDRFVGQDDYCVAPVTHWMELPPPPSTNLLPKSNELVDKPLKCTEKEKIGRSDE
jgi:hypothetical protein